MQLVLWLRERGQWELTSLAAPACIASVAPLAINGFALNILHRRRLRRYSEHRHTPLFRTLASVRGSLLLLAGMAALTLFYALVTAAMVMHWREFGDIKLPNEPDRMPDYTPQLLLGPILLVVTIASLYYIPRAHLHLRWLLSRDRI